MHFFIRQKLGDKHDSGLLWFSAALFVWFLMGVLEFSYSGLTQDYLAEHYKETWPYWYGRKAFSIFNSAFFVYSLSYLRDGWLRIHKRLEHLNVGVLAIITIALCFATFPLEPRIWMLTDTIVSVLVAVLLCWSMAAIFWQRGIPLMAAFTLLVWFFLTYTQLAELWKDPNFSAPSGGHFWIDDRLVRMLSRPSLVICILVLAISWLGTQLEEEVVSRAPGGGPNSLRFELRGMRRFVTMSLQTEAFAIRNVVFDLTHRPSLYTFWVKCAERTVAGENFHREEFTDNFDTMVKRLLEPLNQKLSDENLNIILQKNDLFLRDGKGLYRLVFSPGEITL